MVENVRARAILKRMRLLMALLCGCALWAPPVGWAGTLAQFRTPLGDIEVELYDSSKPVTVANFIRYVQSGAYDNTFFHRWEPGFVVQGGGFFAGVMDNQVRLLPINTLPSIVNEYGAGRIFRNTYGTIAMARVSGQTNSATSQWFFNLVNNPHLDELDGGFTVFGRVLRGTNVLNRFNLTSTSNGIYRVDIDAPFTALPVLSAQPTWEDLVFTDVTLLSVQVTQTTDGFQEVSWRSVSNKVNRVEFTTQFPPVWTELISTNGTGALLNVRDPQPPPHHRFYRVRVDY